MRSINGWWVVLACALWGADVRLPTHKMTSASTPSASIQAIHAVVDGDATLLDIVLHGQAAPTLKGSGNRLVITLPNTTPGRQLAANLTSGGLVTTVAVDLAPPPAKETRLTLALSAPSLGTLTPGPNRETLRVRIAPITAAGKGAPTEAVHSVERGLYDVDAFQSDVTALLKSLAREAGVSVVMAGTVDSKVTVDLHQVPIEKAIDLLTKSAGMAYHKDGDTFVVGSIKDIDAAYPKPQVTPEKLPIPATRQEVYHCRHISASDLVVTLEKMFNKEDLHVCLGATPYSPRLDEANASSVTGVESSTLKSSSSGGSSSGGGTASGGDYGGSSASGGQGSRDVVLYGEESQVVRALDLAQKLDARRLQIKISVRITDIDLNALKQLGVQWTWSDFNITEKASSGINFGSFSHTPVNMDATISALETQGRAKMLAAPNLSLLDGEHGYILIGQRLLYPKLIGYSQAQTPIFDKEEERVGIYLQVAVQTAADGEITLTIYPQVSTVAGYLNINGASYPQINTREQETTVRVKDGQQIVVGGLISEQEIVNIQHVPILSSIPFFGELFTYHSRTKSKTDVVIMITPHIEKD